MSLDASPDTQGESVELLPPEARAANTILPTDLMDVEFAEPVDAAAATSFVKLTAAGKTLAGALSLPPLVAGRIVSASFRPTAFFPFDAELALLTGGLSDPVGNPISSSGTPLRTVPDPGSALQNPGFENGLSSWIATGHQVGPAGTYDGLAPVQGSQQLIVREESGVAGYFDVPSDATTVSLSIAVFSEIGQFDKDRSAVVALYTAPGQRTVLFDAYDERQASMPCMCADFGQRIGPERKSLSLTALRGQRVFLTAEARSAFFIGANYYAVALDDLQIKP
jgi:hypothetical protein